MNQPRHRFTFVTLLILLTLLLVTQTLSAQTKTFSWEDWNTEMTLRENGDIYVVETQTLNFAGAPFTFGYRTIRTGISGANDDITNITVSEGPLDYELSTSQWPSTYRLTRSDDEVTIIWYF